MAELENETLELIGALNQSGFEWLSAEILIALRSTTTNLVSEDDLKKVRAKVKAGDDERDYFPDEQERDDILSGEEQIDAAAEMVWHRLKLAAEMLLESEKSLRNIHHRGFAKQESIEIKFGLYEDARSVTSASVNSMVDAVSKIENLLDNWRSISGPTLR